VIFKRFFKKRIVRRVLLSTMLASIGMMIAAVSGCVVVSNRAARNFHPVNEPLSPEHNALIDSIPKYRRPESATYLTFPEWYLVFNPQEYAQALAQRPPSQFPYFKSIGQLWTGYAEVYGATKHNYPFDTGTHLMVMVIGTSSTVEYTIKGVYENTVGRASEFTASKARTAEDDFAAQVAKDYGNFVTTQPWFDFPFGHKLAGLWTDNRFFGPHFPRKCERKFFLSLEYGVKSLYAGVIRLASHAVYGVADTEVYATVTNIPESAFTNPDVKKIRQLEDGTVIITVPHYQGFTDTVPVLAQQGVEFVEIAGNDEILLTIVAPADWTYDLAGGHPLFTMELLSGTDSKRVAIQAPVKSLGALLREVEAKHLKVEHLYDY
jgi:hypothetical protein